MADQGSDDDGLGGPVEERAIGRKWGIGRVGMAVGVILGALGIILNREYLAYLGAAVFVIFGLIAAGIRTGWFNIPGIGGGGGSFSDADRSIEAPYVVDDEPKQPSPGEPDQP